MTEGENQQPLPPQNYRPSTEDLRQARTARNLTMFASIAGPVSLLIGGVVLSGAGLVCGFSLKQTDNNTDAKTPAETNPQASLHLHQLIHKDSPKFRCNFP